VLAMLFKGYRARNKN